MQIARAALAARPDRDCGQAASHCSCRRSRRSRSTAASACAAACARLGVQGEVELTAQPRRDYRDNGAIRARNDSVLASETRWATKTHAPSPPAQAQTECATSRRAAERERELPQCA